MIESDRPHTLDLLRIIYCDNRIISPKLVQHECYHKDTIVNFQCIVAPLR
jgi:hypothetical protein